MTTLETRYAQASSSRGDVARIDGGAQYMKNIERTATRHIVVGAVVRPGRTGEKSPRRPLISTVTIAGLALLVVFLGATQVCQACDPFKSMQEHAGNQTVLGADKDGIVGIVWPVSSQSSSTDSLRQVATVPVDAEALKQW